MQSAADWLSARGHATLPAWRDGPCWGEGRSVFTASGRSAIALAARTWNVGAGDEILVPAYNCGSELGPLAATGATLIMYRVDETARIDVADLLGRITVRTRIIHIINYFGRPAEIGPLRAICTGRGIRLLEDCALSLFSTGTGILGDAAVFSFRKSLPAIDGGLLWMPRGGALPPALRSPPTFTIVKGFGQQTKSWFVQSVNRRRSIGSDRPLEAGGSIRDTTLPDLPASYAWPNGTSIHRASRFTVGLLRRTDPALVVARRRANYAILRRSLAGTPGIAFLWDDEDLPPGMCPLGLPILVGNKGAWCDGLRAAGIFVSPWWTGCFRGLDWHAFPDALALKSRLVLLPVHQGLAARDMAYIADVVRTLARSGQPGTARKSYLQLPGTSFEQPVP